MITDEQKQEDEAKKSGNSMLGKAMKDQQKKATRKIVQETIKAILMPILIKVLIALPIIIVIFRIVDFLGGGGINSKVKAEGTPISIFQGSTIQEKTWFALKGLGYTDITVAGAMGNIHYESRNFDPTVVNGDEDTGAIGICQWREAEGNSEDNPGRNRRLKIFAKSRGKEWTDENIQVEFLVGELTEGGGADGYAYYELAVNPDWTEKWINADNVKDATEAFCKSFERCSEKEFNDSIDERVKLAEEYYDEFQGKTFENNSEMQIDNSEDKWLKGTILINNRNFYIYNQEMDNSYESSLGLEDWVIRCGRAATICITSGYSVNDKTQALEMMKKMDNEGSAPTHGWFSSYGLTLTQIKHGNTGNYDYRDTVRTTLNSGGQVLIYVRGKKNNTVNYGGPLVSGITGKGKSDTTWTSTWHWMAILGYRNNDGKEEMYIANSTSPKSGWYGLDEFLVDDGKEVANIYVIKK